MSQASTTPPAPPVKKKMVRRKKKTLTPKQKLVQESAQQRFKIEKLVFVWQEKLFSQAQVSPQTLQRASVYLQPKTFEEVIEERVVQEWCAYPLCKSPPQQVQKYKISLGHRKVFDQSELANYCSESCWHKGKYYIMQLSEEPVWFRDLNVLPTIHVILMEEDFKTAIQLEKRRAYDLKSNQDIRQGYVQHLLANVPKDTKEKFTIIEKSTVAPPSTIIPDTGVYDSIEGYRIEVKKNGNSPSTMIIKKKSPEVIKKEQEEQQRLKEEEEMKNQEQEIDEEDPEALFETMMMLKDMHMDRDDAPNDVVANKPLVEKREEEKVETIEKTLPSKPTAAESKPKEEKKVTFDADTKEASVPSSSATNKKDEKVIQVTTEKPKKAPKKKKKAVPELSLFGTIWTILDHMTTKATRVYLSELQTNNQRVDVSALLAQEDLLDEAVYLRGQIFSERILDTYGIIRTQLEIGDNLEDDIVNVIKTFRLSDASMVALNPAQCYMMTLILIKALADILLKDSAWKQQFELCCNTIDQSTDTVDACVRVLKIASV